MGQGRSPAPLIILSSPRERRAVVHPTAGRITAAGNPVEVEGEHFEVTHHPQAHGEDTVEVLQRIGYTRRQLEALREKRIVNSSQNGL